MTWNYRIIKNKEGYYELVEELRNAGLILDKGQPVIQNGYTENMLTEVYKSPRELIGTLELMLKDAKKYKPIKLDYLEVEKKTIKKLKK
jgi:hypothetical protein